MFVLLLTSILLFLNHTINCPLKSSLSSLPYLLSIARFRRHATVGLTVHCVFALLHDHTTIICYSLFLVVRFLYVLLFIVLIIFHIVNIIIIIIIVVVITFFDFFDSICISKSIKSMFTTTTTSRYTTNHNSLTFTTYKRIFQH